MTVSFCLLRKPSEVAVWVIFTLKYDQPVYLLLSANTGFEVVVEVVEVNILSEWSDPLCEQEFSLENGT